MGYLFPGPKKLKPTLEDFDQVERKRVFFGGLNELRAIAAFSVVFHHIEQYKHVQGRDSLYDTILEGFIENLGSNAVWLFFVLSGFLITYLLLVEHEETGEIRVVDFYMRRALRIWPLYFLIVVLAFFVVPMLPGLIPGLQQDALLADSLESLNSNFGIRLLLFALLLPNLALILFGTVAGATQTWSIGSEEQFYLLWPIIVRMFRKTLPMTLLILILAKMVLLVVAVYLGAKYDVKSLIVLGKFLLTLRLELMAIGAMGAYALLHHQSTVESVVRNRWFQVAICALTLMLLNWNFGASYLVLGMAFTFVTISVTVDGGIPVRNKILDRLGRVSYGVYMYHPLVIILAFAIVRRMGIENRLVFNLALYVAVLMMIVLVSFLSYRYFENFFLRGKTRFATILSGDAAAEQNKSLTN